MCDTVVIPLSGTARASIPGMTTKNAALIAWIARAPRRTAWLTTELEAERMGILPAAPGRVLVSLRSAVERYIVTGAGVTEAAAIASALEQASA